MYRASLVMKPQVVFVLGGPGAGKGTQCSKIVEVGEMAREKHNGNYRLLWLGCRLVAVKIELILLLDWSWL